MRLRMDIFRVVEHILYGYPKLLAALAERQLESGCYLGATGEKIGSNTNLSDTTANNAIREADDVILNRLQDTVNKVNRIFEDNPQYYQLYQIRYVQGVKLWGEIVELMGKSERQCHNYRRGLVEEIAREVTLETLSVIYDLLQ